MSLSRVLKYIQANLKSEPMQTFDADFGPIRVLKALESHEKRGYKAQDGEEGAWGGKRHVIQLCFI